MTIDKIKFYLGSQNFDFISSLDAPRLEIMLNAVTQDINYLESEEGVRANLKSYKEADILQFNEIIFKRKVEKKYIERRLGEKKHLKH